MINLKIKDKKFFRVLEENGLQLGNNFFERILNEDNKDLLKVGIVNTLYENIRRKKDKKDARLIDDSNGEFKKLYNYSYIIDAIAFIKQTANGKASDLIISYTEVCQQSINYLEDNSPGFKEGYLSNNELIKLIYSSVVMAVIDVIAVLLAVSFDFVRNPDDSYVIVFKENNRRRIQNLDNLVANLKKFNKSAASGNLAEVLEKVSKESELKEGYEVGLSWLEEIWWIPVVIIAGLVALLFSMRYFVYLHFLMKQSISDELGYIADLVQLNINSQGKMDVKTKKKQEEWVKRLQKYQKKLDVNIDSNVKKVEREIEQENKKNVNTNNSGDEEQINNNISFF